MSTSKWPPPGSPEHEDRLYHYMVLGQLVQSAEKRLKASLEWLGDISRANDSHRLDKDETVRSITAVARMSNGFMRDSIGDEQLAYAELEIGAAEKIIAEDDKRR